MSFTDRITRTPRPYDPDRGAEGVAPFADHPAEVRDLLRGAAGCSPFLKDAMLREAEWLDSALSDPEKALTDTLTFARDLPDAEVAAGLRRAKARVALLVGLADLGGVWDLGQVTGALTDLADVTVARALAVGIASEIARGKLPGYARPAGAGTGAGTGAGVGAGAGQIGAGSPDDAAGMVVLAMGKMGAGELNYSSDIDLICLFDETRFDPGDVMAARAAFVRATQRMARLLSDRTADGYVFRTDLRLRPDPSVTPVCVGMEAAERYYESVGRTWERAAHIKARPCAGDIAGGVRYLEALRPFIWRRQLDFAAIRDAYDMRLRIRSHKGLGGDRPLEGYDLKLGRGGIREIEFFTQTRQIIAGGRDPDLRVRGTCDGLSRLADAGWVTHENAATLQADYVALREIEHRVQMVNDAQTHALPSDTDGFARLAAMMDRDVSDLCHEIAERFDRVAGTTEAFFDPEQGGETGGAAGGAQPPALTAEQTTLVAGWRGYPALRSHRAQEIFDRLRPDLLARLGQSAAPDRALIHLDGFLAGLPAGVQVFSLFEANPTLIDLIIDIADTAPGLAKYLSRNAGVFDAVIGGAFFADWPGQAALEQDLAGQLKQSADYEERLDQARAWAKEWKFRIGVHHLRALIDAETAGAQYSDVAGAVLSVLWPLVRDHFAERHGAPPGRGACVLGMGSLGAGWLNAASDLDLIVIYDADGVEASEGRRPLAAQLYYARLTQALVTALSAAMANGKLYEVDMRLRPSGRQGPVATALAAFRTYQLEEAWTWEHLALTRARPIAGGDLCQEIDAFRTEVLARPRDPRAVWTDVADMRDRLAEAKAGAGKAGSATLDAKAGPGRLADIELVAAACALLTASPVRDPALQLGAGVAAGILTAQAGDALVRIHSTFRAIHNAARLLSADPLDPAQLGAGGLSLLLRGTGVADADALSHLMSQMADEAAAHVADVVGKGTPPK